MKLNLFCFIIFSLNTLTIARSYLNVTSEATYLDSLTVPLSVLTQRTEVNRCIPSPCGPDSKCLVEDGEVLCSCNADFECNADMACIEGWCLGVQARSGLCTWGKCGYHMKCIVRNHVPYCQCSFDGCEVQFPRHLSVVDLHEDTCIPSPCGRMFWHWDEYKDGKSRYICLPNYVRSPPECLPECQKKKNVCADLDEHIQPCTRSSCGPHSECREVSTNGKDLYAICRCQSNFIGTPPNCRPECTVNSECASDKACLNRKCVDPCVYKCARNANCTVIAHNPICSCQDGFAGDPFNNCMPLLIPTQRPEVNPCIPSPCGLYSQCQEFNGKARCTCLPNYISSPPRCRLECSTSFECNPDLECFNNRCSDPCPRDCGNHAQCVVKNHRAYCTCLPDSCQALDQTFDFPRYPEWSPKFGNPKEEAVSDMEARPKRAGGSVQPYLRRYIPPTTTTRRPCYTRSCISASLLRVNHCLSGTVRYGDLCVETDDDHENN